MRPVYIMITALLSITRSGVSKVSLNRVSCSTRVLVMCVFIGLSSGCTTADSVNQIPERGNFELILNPVRLGTLLPGGYFSITSANLVNEAQYEVYLDLNQVAERIALEVIEVSGGALIVRWPIDQGRSSPIGPSLGSLLVTVRTASLLGNARTEWSADLQRQLTPELTNVSELVSPQTSTSLRGDRFLNPGEGESLLNLSGFVTRPDGTSAPIELSVIITSQPEGTPEIQELISSDRTQRWWIPSPAVFGIQAQRFEGSAQVTNRGELGLTMSAPVNVTFEYSDPFLSRVTPPAVSRGQRISIEGGGFIDLVSEDKVGLTSVTLNGVLTPFNPQQPPIEYNDQRLEVRRISGDQLVTSFNPLFNDVCESPDLGGTSGELQGVLSATMYWGDQEVTTSSLPISLEIAPTKQVVYLSFLPAFTDSLRLFGLRNVSSRVIDEIIGVVRRDFTGINLDIRTSPPQDFERYSIVELGGPDPNARSLFGLDNTTGLDYCNQRLDDALAGRNAESGDSYGGVFVESFLNLSPSRNPEPSALADPLFDQIFTPLIEQPAQQRDLTGARSEEVILAIRVLGHLVGNTLTHEIGHSLGLPVIAGCGEYHNAPGPRQIMDCGQDRPFLERAGLDPEGPPQWTAENLSYLQMILPL